MSALWWSTRTGAPLAPTPVPGIGCTTTTPMVLHRTGLKYLSCARYCRPGRPLQPSALPGPIVYLDNDAVIQNMSQPIETLLASSGERWWVMELFKGITSHTLILKNTMRSRAMLDHLWHLRTVCPACPKGEQCAVHLLIHELLIEWARFRGQSQVWVRSDKGTPCCSPQEHCAFPTGTLAENNSKASTAVQGCTWNWWTALNPNRLVASHRHIHWIPWVEKFRMPLNVLHPVKKLTTCMQVNPWYNNATPVDPGRIDTVSFLRQMQQRPDHQLAVQRSPRLSVQLRTAEVFPGLNLSGYRPRRSFRLCHIVRVAL
eukprot:GGOE01045420.1.p1 GENE.GGOE01045420.1~~GGOE01045420.1.p1  ORF type:complete len:316 (-),score=46.91 GGOE01045420.1:512-1459(-)